MSDAGPSCILLVEDNEALRECLCDVLRELGYAVLSAASAAQALELFHRHRPHAVITDHAMGASSLDTSTDGSGLALAARIKAASPLTPVVMLSASPPQAAAAVCDVVLTKPTPIRTLANTLQRLNVCPHRVVGQTS